MLPEPEPQSAQGDRGDERRRDLVFRTLVDHCQPVARWQVLSIDRRGMTDQFTWVRFGTAGMALADAGQVLRLLLIHSPGPRTFVVEAYYEDVVVQSQSPWRKLLQPYEPHAESWTVSSSRVAASVAGWFGDAQPPGATLLGHRRTG
jgi:hypothetical protein